MTPSALESALAKLRTQAAAPNWPVPARITSQEAAALLAKIEAQQWLPIETAPRGPVLVARITDGRLYWAEAAHRGDGALRCMWYSPCGSSIPSPTHWAPLPEPLAYRAPQPALEDK